VALVPVLAGCGSGFDDRLGPYRMEVSSLGVSTAQVTFVYDQEKQGCRTLDADFSVDVDGMAPVLVERGESFYSVISGRFECNPPSAFILKAGVLGVTSTITASTGGDTMVAEVQDLGAMLPSEPILGPGETVHVGQLVRFAVGPGFDRVQWPSVAFLSVPDRIPIPSDSVTISPPSADGVLEVQLPSTLPAGTTQVDTPVEILPKITRCEGSGGCFITGSMEVSFSGRVNVLP
jgi:hypothetical protein